MSSTSAQKRIDERIPDFKPTQPLQKETVATQQPFSSQQVATHLKELNHQTYTTSQMLEQELTHNLSRSELIQLVLKQKAESEHQSKLVAEKTMLERIASMKRKEAESRYNGLKKKYHEALDQLQSYKDTMSTTKTEITAKEQLLHKKSSRLSELQKQQESKEAYIKKLEEQQHFLEDKLKRLQQEIHTQEAATFDKKLKQVIRENNNETLSLKATIDTQRSKIDELQSTLRERRSTEKELLTLFQQKLQ